MTPLPAFLPSHLGFLKDLETDEAIFESLKTSFRDFFLFFEAAAGDETWSRKHVKFVELAGDFLSDLQVQDRLDGNTEEKVAQLLWEHPDTLVPYFQKNVALTASSQKILESGFLVSSVSLFFRELVRKGFRDGKAFPIEIALEVEDTFFHLLVEFIEKGEIANLWRLQEKELWELLEIAKNKEINKLFEDSEKVLIRYIKNDNALEKLKKSEKLQCTFLKKSACDHLNQKYAFHVHLEARDAGISFEFLNYYDQANELFDKLKPLITTLGASGRLALQPNFLEAIEKIPRLMGVDVHGSKALPPAVLEMPVSIHELNLSSCDWLNGQFLKIIALEHPQIERLFLRNSPHLSPDFWIELQRFSDIIELDVARCPQIQNDQFHNILQACPHLHKLVLSECTRITESGFLKNASHLQQAHTLIFSKTHLSDKALMTLIRECRRLNFLDISKCPELTSKGIEKARQSAPPHLVILD